MDEAAIRAYIEQTYAGVDVVTGGEGDAGTFFSLDPETHWPNFATLVTSDAFDDASDLSRDGVFRLNIGIGKETFERLFPDGAPTPDPTALDVVFPHPVYAAQRWVSITSPSDATWASTVVPMLDEAYQRLASARARHGKA